MASGKGKLVDILHHFGDLLWESHADQPIPNPGFTNEMVLPLAHDDGGDSCEPDEESLPVDEEYGTLVEEQEKLVIGESSAEGSTAPSDDHNTGGGIEMDGLLEIALLQALHKSVKDDMLPLPAGKLLQLHMVPNR